MPDETRPSLQDRFAPHNRCFGCGPSNPEGLRIKSYPTADEPDAEVVCTWTPEPHHEAFEGVLNGGIIGALLDCHSNWTAAWTLMRRQGATSPPCTVTAEFHVRMRKPTPMDGPLQLTARPVSCEGNRVEVHAELAAGGEVTATCEGVFVAVKPGHPAYHRW
jgi:acyl-coenzyme A thioesterase PaaI-like protein